MLNMDFKVLFEGENISRLLDGLLITTEIAFFSVIISIIIGVIFGIVMLSNNKLIRAISIVYLEIVRIVPILVLLFIAYFGVAKFINVHLDGVLVSIIVFSIWGIAEVGDLVRGAVTSIPVVQKESAKSVGLNDIQIYLYILLPQAFRRIIPSVINLSTRMIKTTSLVVLIGVVEVVKVGQQIIESSIFKAPTASFWIYGFIFILYFIICYPLSVFSKKLEKVLLN